MDLERGVQITRPVGGLAFASTETDAVFILFAHLPGFMKDEIEVELNEAGTEISISSKGEIGERSFIDAEILGRVRISHHELTEGFRKAFPIPSNVVLDQIEVGFEEEEDILIVLLPKLTREEEPSGVEIEEINEENIREEEEEEEEEEDDDDDDDDDDDEEEERTSMTIEAEETSPDYNKEKAQEQQNLGEVEPKNSTEKIKGKPDGKPDAGSREATTKIAIEDKEDSESELIIEELGFTIMTSISKEPIASKSEEEKEKEEEATEQKNLNELEVTKSLEALESESEGLESKETVIGAQTNDKEEETGLIIEEPDFTIIPLPLDEPIIFKASEMEEEEEEEEEEEGGRGEETTLDEKEQKQEQKNLYELEPTISLGESEGEPDEEIKPQNKEIAIEAKIINDDEEKNELIIEEPDFTTTPPPQEQIALKASDSKEEKNEEEEEKEKATEEEVEEHKDLDELESKKILEALEGELDGKTNSEHREMIIEAQNGDKEEEKAGPIKEESDFTRTSPSEKHVASKFSKLKEKKKSTREEVPKQNDLDKLEPKKISKVLEGEFDGKTKQEHREMTIEAQTGDKENGKTRLIRKEPYFTKTPPPSEEPVISKASELKEEKKNVAGKGVAEQHNLDELKPKKILEALEGESDGKTKPEHREMAREVQSGDKERKQTGFIREEPDFTSTPPSEKPIASKTFELKEEEKKATWEEVLEKNDLDGLKPKKISKALESEYDGKTKLEHREIVIEAQTDDKKEEKIRLIKEDPGFTRTPPPSEELIASKAFELKEEEEKAIGEEVSEQKDLGELELKKISNVLESESDRKTKPEHREMIIEAQTGDEKEEKTILVRDEPYFIRTPPLSEKPVVSKTFELKEEEEKTTGGEESEQKDLDELGPKNISKALESEYDGKTKPESREMTIEAQTDKKKEEKIGLIREESDFTRIPPLGKPIASKTFELKEEKEKATWEKVPEQKNLDELEPKKISKALESESDGKIKPEHQEMTIEAQTGDKEEEKIRLIREEPEFTRTPPPSEELVASKSFELKEEEKKAIENKVQEQKDLDGLESKKISKILEDEFDGKIKPEYQEMAIETRTGDKEEEEKNGLTRVEPDFTRTPPPLEEPIASKAFELKEEEEKATREEVLEQNDLDELESKKILEALEGEPDGKIKSEHREMTIEAQTSDKEEKAGLIREESDFTRTPLPSEESVASKASELKEEEEKTAGEQISEQKDLDELDQNRNLEVLEGEFNGKIKPEHQEMAIKAQTGDKEEEKNGLTIVKPDFTRTPPSEEPIASKAFELKEDEKATREEVSEQKDLDELESKKILEALEGEPVGKSKSKHQEMAIEAQTGTEEEKNGLIRKEPYFTITPLPSEEPVASKTSKLKEDEKVRGKEVSEQKYLDELEPKKIFEALEGESNGKTKREYREMAIEKQIGDKEEEKIRLIREGPYFIRTSLPSSLPSEEPVASKASELKEEEEKAARKEVQERKDLDTLELEKGLEASEGEPNEEIELVPTEMAIETPSEHKEEEQTRIHTAEPKFTIAPPALEEPILSNASKLKEEEEEKAHKKNTEEPKNLEKKIQSKTFEEEKKGKKEKAIEEKSQEQKSLDELQVKKSSEEIEGEPCRETKPEPKKTAIGTQAKYKEEEETRRITEEPDIIVLPSPLEDLIASKASKSKEENEEQHEKAPTEEIPFSPPISPNIMTKPKSNGEQLDTTDSHEERDRDVEVPRQALETSESIESSKQEEDRHGFGKEDAKEPKNVEEITHDPAPKTLTRTVTPKDVGSDRRRGGEHEARETKIRALREDDREIVSDVDGGEDASREWEEGESSDRDREESRGEMEMRKEEKGNNGNRMNGIRKNAQRKRRRRRKRGSSFHLPTTDVIAGSVFVLTLAALVIRLIKKRRSHTMR